MTGCQQASRRTRAKHRWRFEIPGGSGTLCAGLVTRAVPEPRRNTMKPTPKSAGKEKKAGEQKAQVKDLEVKDASAVKGGMTKLEKKTRIKVRTK